MIINLLCSLAAMCCCCLLDACLEWRVCRESDLICASDLQQEVMPMYRVTLCILEGDAHAPMQGGAGVPGAGSAELNIFDSNLIFVFKNISNMYKLLI